MRLLDGDLPRQTYAAFRGKTLSGIARRTASPESAALDGFGDPAPAPPQDFKIEGFTEAYSRYTLATAGIPATDVKLNIFAASAPGYRPQENDQVRLDRRQPNGQMISEWVQIRGPISIDPAKALWECQSFEIPAPRPVS